MRVKLQFVSNKPIVLPVHYLYSVHQLVYKLFTPAVAHKIYLDGFPYKGRKLKLFNYSRIHHVLAQWDMPQSVVYRLHLSVF